MLRLGCAGCLTVLLLVAVMLGAAWSIVQIARAPDIANLPATPADGLRAQQKIFDLVRRAGAGRAHAVSLSEPELNAFLSRHLAASTDLPLRNLAVHLYSDNRVEIAGQVQLRQLLTLPPFSALAAIIPTMGLDRDLWLTVRARVTLDGTGAVRERRRLRLDVERFWLGRLPLPELVLRLLLDPEALRLLRWPIPETIDQIRIEPGRVVVHAGP